MVNVTKENFIEQSNDFLYHLPKASFIAIDEEMTGISIVNNNNNTNGNRGTNPNNNSKDCTPAQRYETELKFVPEKYTIIQFGIALYFCTDTDNNDSPVLSPSVAVTATTTSTSTNTNTSINNNQQQRHSVTQLPSSPIRTSNSASSSITGSGRRGYVVDPTILNNNNNDNDSNNNNNTNILQLPVGTKYTVRRYNFYMFPNSTSASMSASSNLKMYENHTTGNRNGDTNSSSNSHNNKQNYIPIPSPPTTLPNHLRDIVLNPGTVAFLQNHNMSFDLWMKYGISYASSNEYAQYYTHIYQIHEIKQQAQQSLQSPNNGKAPTGPTIQDSIRKQIVLTRPEDIEFHARTMATLREWLDNPITPVTATNVDRSNCSNGGIIDDPFMINHSILLPSCNSFLRRALYESIQKEYPTLICENSGHQSSQIRVWRLSPSEIEIRNLHLQQQRYNDFIVHKIGIYRIFEAIRLVCNGYAIDYTNPLFAKSYNDIDWDTITNSYNTNEFEKNDKNNNGYSDTLPKPHEKCTRTAQPIPLVVHNGFMDLCFLMTHFVTESLPDNYHACKELLHTYFPYIYDTKVIATECLCWDTNETTNSNTNLSNLFHMIVRNPIYYYQNNINDMNDEDHHRSLLDDIYVVPYSSNNSNSSIGNTIVVVEDQEHEAAFDAYMTGCIFIGLCQRISQRIVQQRPLAVHAFPRPIVSTYSTNYSLHTDIHNELRSYYGLNKIYQMSIYTTDLEEERYNRDPMSKGMLSESTYRVSNIDRAVSTRDIVQALSNLNDSKNRPVNFVIVWIDDTTFLVAASYRPESVVTASPVVQAQQPIRPVLEEGEEEEEGTVIDTSEVDDSLTTTATAPNNDGMNTILREHGSIILHALQVRFNNNEKIVVQEDYLAQIANASKKIRMGVTNDIGDDDEAPKSLMSRIWSILGWTTTYMEKKHSLDDRMESSSNKRQRIS